MAYITDIVTEEFELDAHLEPCPFCGSSKIVCVEATHFNHSWNYMKCTYCGAQGGLASCEEKAVKYWNDREGEH